MFRSAASALIKKSRMGTTCAGWQRGLTQTSFLLPDPAEDKGLQLSKIVATIGPTSEQREPLREVTDAGMTIMRLNFSHATTEEVELRTTNLALAQKDLQPKGAVEPQSTRAVLLDTKGPEIRSGKLANDDSGHETVHLKKGASISLFNDPARQEAEASTNESLFIDYPGLDRCLSQGMKVLLDDGAIILTVQSVSPGSVVCRVDNNGDLRSRAGVNLPLADTSDLPAMSDKDKQDIKYGMSMDIDYVAASFVQTAEGVREIRQHIAACANELGWEASRPLPMIISKIETAGALSHFDAILDESDAIMVARGDLGVEIPLTQVTNAQKEMVAACNTKGKPVIVATQMLESMGKNPRPTRAEVSDVTNAIYDGADCVMLSGETAKGKYPTESVATMNEIITAAERYGVSGALGNPQSCRFEGLKSEDSAVAKAAVTAVNERGCSAILVLANRSAVAPLVSAFRPSVPILTFCSTSKIARRLQIYRGIHPIVNSGLDGMPSSERPQQAVREAKGMDYVQAGDEVVIVFADGDAANMTIAKVE